MTRQHRPGVLHSGAALESPLEPQHCHRSNAGYIRSSYVFLPAGILDGPDSLVPNDRRATERGR